jgi:hypothetical protein
MTISPLSLQNGDDDDDEVDDGAKPGLFDHGNGSRDRRRVPSFAAFYPCPVEGCVHTMKFRYRPDIPVDESGQVSDARPWGRVYSPNTSGMRKHFKDIHPDFLEKDWPCAFAYVSRPKDAIDTTRFFWYHCPVASCAERFGFRADYNPPLTSDGMVSDRAFWSGRQFQNIVSDVRTHMREKHAHYHDSEWPPGFARKYKII